MSNHNAPFVTEVSIKKLAEATNVKAQTIRKATQRQMLDVSKTGYVTNNERLWRWLESYPKRAHNPHLLNINAINTFVRENKERYRAMATPPITSTPVVSSAEPPPVPPRVSRIKPTIETTASDEVNTILELQGRLEATLTSVDRHMNEIEQRVGQNTDNIWQAISSLQKEVEALRETVDSIQNIKTSSSVEKLQLIISLLKTIQSI